MTRVNDGRCDMALALLLFVTTVLYLATLPLNLGTPDEAHALLAAKRVFDGEVMYRDVFDLSTPGWVMGMAALFGLLGPSLATARMTVAMIHGGTALLMFLACRWLGVRRGLAWACAFAYLVVCQPMFPIASYHWLATFLSVALLVLCLRSTANTSWAFSLGLGVGLLIAVHQQRGLSMGLGVASVLVARAIIQWRYGISPRPLSVWRQTGAFAGGVTLVVGSLLVGLVATAGFQPVWNALVIVPLVNYRGAISCPWGHDWTGGSRSPFSPFLEYLPAILAVSMVPLLVLCWRRRNAERVRVLTILTLLCAFAILSISYYPDTIHLAFIAPLFFVTSTDAFERLLRLLPTPMSRPVAGLTTAAVVLAGGVELWGNLITLRARYPVAYQSAFGRIDLRSARTAQVWEQMKAFLDRGPSRELYAYPMANYTYLLLDARNPTRFAFVTRGRYTSPDQVQEIVDALDTKRVPYVVVTAEIVRSDDRIARFIREHYEPVPALPRRLWRLKGETMGRTAPITVLAMDALPWHRPSWKPHVPFAPGRIRARSAGLSRPSLRAAFETVSQRPVHRRRYAACRSPGRIRQPTRVDTVPGPARRAWRGFRERLRGELLDLPLGRVAVHVALSRAAPRDRVRLAVGRTGGDVRRAAG